MKKIIRKICAILIVLCISVMSVVVYGFYAIPDEYHTICYQNIDTGIYTCSFDSEVKASKILSQEGIYKLNLSLFNAIPVKTSELTVTNRRYVIPSGDIIGLRLFTKGVMVVGSDAVETSKGNFNPVNASDVKKGDVIIKLNGVEISNSTQVEKIITESEGESLQTELIRDNNIIHTVITPVYSLSENKYKTGLWIRDSAAGIGTMTFYEKESGFFACLGHAVCDVDTGEELPLANGDVVNARITGCVKGKCGRAGELCGSFSNDCIGVLYANSSFGVFGFVDDYKSDEKEIGIALVNEIEEGAAEIISTVSGEGKSHFDITIEKIDANNKEGKNLIIKITDSDLLEETGGIVQGMSGSPIIQNGKLIGAVTHVFLNDPTRGYGIFIDNMLDAA